MKTVKQALIEARAKIDTPDKWCKGALARDSQRRTVRHLSEQACRFCISGAVSRVTESETVELSCEVMDALDYALQDLGHLHGIVHFNDHEDTTHAKVMKAFDHTIERVKE